MVEKIKESRKNGENDIHHEEAFYVLSREHFYF